RGRRNDYFFHQHQRANTTGKLTSLSSPLDHRSQYPSFEGASRDRIRAADESTAGESDHISNDDGAPMNKATHNQRSSSGFTMLEMLVSLVVFMVVAGAAFSLLFAHAPLYSRQQNMAGLNIVLRNAVTQMQIDAENAGNGYYPGPDI